MVSTSPLEETGKRSVTLETTSDWVAVVTIDVPDSKVNTLGLRSMNELNEIIDQVAASKGLKGLVITSGKKDNFIAGADVNEIRRLQSDSQLEAYKASEMGKELFLKIEQLPLNTVAAINGACLGGGMELALACKFRVASKKARSIGLPEVQLGFVPGWGGCVRMPRLVGLQKAIELIMGSKLLDARKAWRVGLVDEVVEPDKLLERAIEVAQKGQVKRASRDSKDQVMAMVLETNPLGKKVLYDQSYKVMMKVTKGKYPAAKEALKLIMKSAELPADKAYKLESSTFARLAMTTVSKNLVGIFFSQSESKKMPVELAPGRDVTTVGVLGAGVMGAGIAQACAKAGYKVIVKDIEQKFLDKGKETFKSLFEKLVERKRMTREEVDKIVAETVFTVDYDKLKDCDLIIEAVLEDLDVKQTALANCEASVRNDFIFATNTSSLSVTDIASEAKDPARVVGLHFFNPVHKMPLVEVVRGKKTSDEAVAFAMQVALKLDKTTVITKDSPGFIVNRILAPYLREAAVLTAEGVPIEDIDKAMKSFGMPMGPMALLDEVGLDIAGKVVHVMHEALGERLAPPPLMGQIADLKLLGKKSGKGIYLYDENGKPAGVNPDVQALIKVPVAKKLPGVIQDRLVLLMVNEAARCLEEGVVATPAQLDLAMIFGTGFAPFHGGPLRYADTEGTDIICQKLEYLSRVRGEAYAPCELLKKLAARRELFYATSPAPAAV
jgi:3-hydroxyacyl-CoA dehydrogenase/enoyl-CoA hydratase/3-hydroxybutyryl-CoA epimerase